MKIQITRIKKEQQELFLNMYNLYLYDLSEFTGEDPKDDGKFDPTNTYLYLERNELHPFFINYDGKNIGFILVCSPPFVSEGLDYTIQELFLLKKYRGLNLAAEAVSLVLDQFSGTIKIDQLERNKAAVAFWKKYYKNENIEFVEQEELIEIDGLTGKHKTISQVFVVQKNV
ncbi:Predicted acetyltransferase [Paenibacillus uliginis N3/975]|uniref:Predicted acetyltransferase n=1 Tax=Paenibacillus uliginis N3/975 TaxID=1313296 RepID=A0A1X7H462_9BACL|nr:GNAT family N-acetyltransferase [Paenibacillus uliginis]SMF79472.1 Predicted acetyltransferase [Paenibacillus uliginis N3/975]